MRTHAVERILEGTVYAREIEREQEAVTAGIARYHHAREKAYKRGDAAGIKSVEMFLRFWFEPLRIAVAEELRLLADGALGHGRPIYGPPLLALNDAERIAAVAIQQTLGRLVPEPTGVPLVSVASTVGAGVLAEIHRDAIVISDEASLVELDRRFKRITPRAVNWYARRKLTSGVVRANVQVRVGMALIDLLVKTAAAEMYEPNFVPAFTVQTRNEGRRQRHWLTLSMGVYDRIERCDAFRAGLRPQYRPMTCAPMPWSRENEGGYVKIRTPLLAKPTRAQRAAIDEAGPSVEPVYRALNAIQSTPWMVNERVLAVAERLWEDGGNVATIPRRVDDPLPPRPDDIATNEEARRAWKAEAAEIHTRNKRSISARLEFVLALDGAQAMVGERWWMPHQFDFRSRVYPLPVHLNHHQGDLSSSLLLFADSKPCDDRWLAVHTANTWGLDKEPFDARIAWVQENIGKLTRIAANPLETVDEWAEADMPWQFLAACFAWRDPEIASRLPVQLDATASGLQHYAALGRDPVTAAAVNLTGTEQRRDVYTHVLTHLRPIVERIASEPGPKQDLAAKALPYLSRSIVKRPVMTTPYNVTRYGIRAQVREELVAAGLDVAGSGPVAGFIGDQIADALGTVCSAAVRIMAWIEGAVRAILDEHPHADIRWTTPLGWPVVQPYRSLRSVQVKTILGTVSVAAPDGDMPADKRKQVAGAPPNFVHSLDATHAQMVALACEERGIALGLVHDSFWTHAATAGELHEVLRAKFAALHCEPLLERLRAEWVERYGVDLDPIPAPGGWDVREVLDSTYSFC